MGPSIADVAAHAGVSAQTVSRVSTGFAGVRPSTRDRVLASMRALGYVPNSAARALKHGAFRTIGVVAHKLARIGESGTVEAVVAAAQRKGFGVSLVDISAPTPDDVSAAVAGLASRSIDGLVIIRAESIDPDDLVLPPNIPVVVSDSHFAGKFPAVATDQLTGGRLAVGHLLDLGHETVAHLAGPEDSLPAQERLHGWSSALEGRRIEPPIHTDWTPRSGYEQGQKLIPRIRSGHITAVFCANDQVALGFYRAAAEAGLRIPHDVSVIGFDNIAEAEFFTPPLTSVAQSFRLIGETLVSLLVQQITSGVASHERTLLPVELVVRASTGAPRTEP